MKAPLTAVLRKACADVSVRGFAALEKEQENIQTLHDLRTFLRRIGGNPEAGILRVQGLGRKEASKLKDNLANIGWTLQELATDDN